MSSNKSLSPKYNPSARSRIYNTVINNPEDATTYLMAGVIPANLFELSTQTSFRDTVLSAIALSPDVDAQLNTLVSHLQSYPAVDNSELVTLCEYAIAIAYAQGEVELAKEIILRVDPKLASSLVQMMYRTIMGGYPVEEYKTMLQSSYQHSRNLWMQNRQQ